MPNSGLVVDRSGGGKGSGLSVLGRLRSSGLGMRPKSNLSGIGNDSLMNASPTYQQHIPSDLEAGGGGGGRVNGASESPVASPLASELPGHYHYHHHPQQQQQQVEMQVQGEQRPSLQRSAYGPELEAVGGTGVSGDGRHRVPRALSQKEDKDSAFS